jgi:hypothetical protein
MISTKFPPIVDEQGGPVSGFSIPAQIRKVSAGNPRGKAKEACVPMAGEDFREETGGRVAEMSSAIAISD